jgi:sec-independent protein translocase protein TatB
MLDFGFSEILLTSAIALVVLGPERLPKVARQVGNWMGRARVMARQLSEQLEREVHAEELMREQKKIAAMLDQPVIKPDIRLTAPPLASDAPPAYGHGPIATPIAPAAPISPAAATSAPSAPAPEHAPDVSAPPEAPAPVSTAAPMPGAAPMSTAPPVSAAPASPSTPAAAPLESTHTVQ